MAPKGTKRNVADNGRRCTANAVNATSGGAGSAGREASQTPPATPPSESISDALALLTGAASGKGTGVEAPAAVMEQPQVNVVDAIPGNIVINQVTGEVIETPDGNEQPEQKNGELDPEAWKSFVKSEKDKERVATYERNIAEFTEQIRAGTEAVEALDQMISTMPEKAQRRKTFETERNAKAAQVKKAQESLATKQKSLDDIKQAAENKRATATEKEQKALQVQRDKDAKALLSKTEAYHVTPLTSEQLQRRSELEDEARKEFASSAEHGMRACAIIGTIYKERLWIDHEGGMAGYVEEAFGVKKSEMYRMIGYDKQLDEIKAIMSKEVKYLDAQGKPEKVELDPSKLPSTKKHLQALQKYGPAENQAKVWEAVATECQANQTPPTERIIRKIGDEMVGSGEISVGLDAQLESSRKQIESERAKAGGQNKLSPLNFNIFENIAEWGGHVFAARSVKDGQGTKYFYPRVDGVTLKAGEEELRFTTLLACVKRLEEAAKELVTDQWNEEAGNSTEDEPGTPIASVADASDRNVPQTPPATAETAKNGDVPAAPAKDRGKKVVKTWFVGMDGKNPDPFDYDVAKDGNPNTEVTGYDAIIGPFESEAKAKDYRQMILDGKVKAPEAAVAAK